MTLPVWPRFIVPSSEIWHPKNMAFSGGVTLLGNEQVVVSPSMMWTAKLQFEIDVDECAIEAEGFISSLYGRANPFLIGPFDNRGKPEQPGAHPRDLYRSNFEVAAAAAMNATTMRLNRIRGGDLRRGHMFTVGDRLHRLTDARKVDTNAFEISFVPWLREAVPQGAVADFDTRVCTMRLANDSSGAIDRSVSPVTKFELELVEAFK